MVRQAERTPDKVEWYDPPARGAVLCKNNSKGSVGYTNYKY